MNKQQKQDIRNKIIRLYQELQNAIDTNKEIMELLKRMVPKDK